MAVNSRNGNTTLETGLFPPARAATTAAIVLSGLQTIDGIVLVAGDRVLVWKQADPTTNGIYAVSSGNWVRTSDTASNSQFFDGMAVLVAPGGAANGAKLFICSTPDDPVVIGTSAITFVAQSDALSAAQQATSTTPLAIGIGPQAFAIAAGKSFAAKQWVLAYSLSDVTKQELAQIVSYAGTALSVSVVAIGGAPATVNDWNIVLTNSAAAAGLMPPVGTGNVTGPGAAVSHNLARFADATGKVIEDSGVAAGALAGRNALIYGDGGVKSIGAASLADGAAPLPYIAAQPNDNLTLVDDVTNPTRDFNVTPGRVRDRADLTNLQLAATMLKRLDLPWAAGGMAGAPAGCLDTGSNKLPGKTYHVSLIAKLGQAVTQRSRAANIATLTVAGHGLGVGGTVRPLGVGGGYDSVAPIIGVTANTLSYANTGADEGGTAVAGAVVDGFDILASQQDVNAYPAPALPAGWTVSQCLGSRLTDGSANIIPTVQVGDVFRISSPSMEISTGTQGTAPVNYPITVPIGVSVLAKLATVAISGTIYLRNPNDAALAASVTVAPLATVTASGANATAQVDVWTDTNAQVTGTAVAASASFKGATLEWRDPRRRLF